MFDEFQTGQVANSRRPVVDTLYDVFVAIRDDEAEHVKTMIACQHPEAQNTLRSPHTASDSETVLTGTEVETAKAEKEMEASTN
jgi:ubiquinol oxidase